MGILGEALSLLWEEPFRTYLTISLYIFPVLTVLSLLFRRGDSVHGLANLPVAGVTMPGYVGLLGARHRNRNFVMPTNCDDRIILTPAQVRELASAPDELLSFEETVDHSFQAKYTGILRFRATGYLQTVVRTKVIRNHRRLMGPMIDEARFALGAELPPCEDLTSLSIYPTVVRIVARVSARAFVGFPLCRNEDLLKALILFTVDVFTIALELGSLPWFLRPLRALFLRSARSINYHRNVAKSCLAPSIEARLAEEEAAKRAGKPPKDYDDTLQWYMDIVRPEHRNPDALAEIMLYTLMTSTHSVALTLINLLLDLASHPEYIQPLREEIETVIREDGGVVQKTTLSKMAKVDSFMRESFRAKLTLFGFARKVLKSFTLSDGTFLPKGAILAAPIVMFDLDPELTEDPEFFDGFRSYKKNLASYCEGKIGRAQCVITSPSYLSFGHGKHACPGRFLAVDVLKVWLCHLLLQYDIMYDEDNPRLPTLNVSHAVIPNDAQKLAFRKIQGPKKFDFL